MRQGFWKEAWREVSSWSRVGPPSRSWRLGPLGREGDVEGLVEVLNLPENVRVTALLGAEVIFMPHVTCGTPSPMPGRGVIAREVWENRDRDPVRCRQEFQGPKGRGWLLRWLPARAYENGVYAVFSNAIGIGHDTIKTGNAMILDPYGEIIAESAHLGDDVAVALCTPEKIERSSGRRYLRARRPELYAKLVEPPPPGEHPFTAPGWPLDRPPDAP